MGLGLGLGGGGGVGLGLGLGLGLGGGGVQNFFRVRGYIHDERFKYIFLYLEICFPEK